MALLPRLGAKPSSKADKKPLLARKICGTARSISRRLLADGVFYRAGQGRYRLLKLQPDEWVCEQPCVGLAGRFGADWPVSRGRGAVAVFTARGLARPELSTLFHRR